MSFRTADVLPLRNQTALGICFDGVAGRLRKDLEDDYDVALHLGQAPGPALWICAWLTRLVDEGPAFGYFSEAAKSIHLVHPNSNAEAP